MNASRSVRLVASVVAAAGVAAGHVPYGGYVAIDSVLYLSTAESLIEGSGFTRFDGAPFVAFPPLYPMILGVLMALGVPGLWGAAAVNVCSAFVAAWIFSGWLLEELSDRRFIAIGLAILVAGRSMLGINLTVLTEPLFVALSLGAVDRIRSLSVRLDARSVALAALLTGLACLTRYMGLALVATGLVTILTMGPAVRSRTTHVVTFAVGATLMPAAWLARNWSISGTATGNRLTSPYGLFDNLAGVVDSSIQFWLPDEIAGALRIAGGLIFLIAVAAGAIRAKSQLVRTLAIWIASYLALLVAAVTLFASDPVGMRLVSPVLLPLLLLAVVLAAQIPSLPARRLALVLGGLLVVLQSVTYARVLASSWSHDRQGLNSARWSESELMGAIRDVKSDGTGLSNQAFGIWFHTGQAHLQLPFGVNSGLTNVDPNEYAHLTSYEESLRAIRNNVGAARLYWFNTASVDAESWAYVLIPPSLSTVKDELALSVEANFADGTIYAARAHPGPEEATGEPDLRGREVVSVAVAANFAPTLVELGTAFEETTGSRVVPSRGSSGKLYAQIRNGAPFDVFFAADTLRPSLLEADGLATAGTRFTYAIGRLAIVAADPERETNIETLLNGDVRFLAIANPDVAPYGEAAKAVLVRLDVWDRLQNRVVRGESVAQAFQFVRSGNADVGLVSLAQLTSSAMLEESHWVVPDSLHPPIRQQAVLLRDRPPAKAFIEFVQTSAGRAIIRQNGYQLP